MYAAIWIDGGAKSPRDKIVVCQPLMQKLNAAWAVLNSESRADAKSLVLSGDVPLLRKFIKRLDDIDNQLDGASDDQLVKFISRGAEVSGLSLAEGNVGRLRRPEGPSHPEDPTRNGLFDIESFVGAAVRTEPKPGTYPRLIHPDAKTLWDEVMMDHRDLIKKYKSNKKHMWAAAILIFKRIAGQEDVVPFLRDPSREKARDAAARDINDRAKKGLSAADRIITTIRKDLIHEGLGLRIVKRRFLAASKRGRDFFISTVQPITPAKGVPPDEILERLVIEHGFAGSGQQAYRNVDGMTDLLAEPEGKTPSIFTTLRLSRDQAIILFGLGDDAGDDLILKKMQVAGRRLIRKGILVEAR